MWAGLENSEGHIRLFGGLFKSDFSFREQSIFIDHIILNRNCINHNVGEPEVCETGSRFFPLNPTDLKRTTHHSPILD